MGWYEENYLDEGIDEDIDEDIYDNEGDLLWDVDGKPAYSLNWIREKFKKDEKLEFLFFWGHQPSNNGSITKTCLSQWWKEEFAIEIYKYCCMEQYMMAEKARVFEDKEMMEKILKSDNPKDIKEYGRKVSNFNEAIWARKRYSIVLNGNYAKFLQSERLMQFLLQTENKILIKASPYDKIWGIGMSSDDKAVNDPFECKGQNLLGFAIMEVRDELNRICQNYNRLNLTELHQDFG
ncbi:NADAR family protein [Paenibacillus sedimenti]|nr:NADAR family protein [Paenibacillus sedimenti]